MRKPEEYAKLIAGCYSHELGERCVEFKDSIACALETYAKQVRSQTIEECLAKCGSVRETLSEKAMQFPDKSPRWEDLCSKTAGIRHVEVAIRSIDNDKL